MIEAAKNFRNGLFKHIDLETKEGKQWIEDIRHRNDVKNMKFAEWFYFHPSAYNLLAFGTPIILIVIYGIVTLLAYLYISQFFIVIGLFVIAIAIRDLYKKIKMRNAMKTMTFNDMWF